MADPHETFNVQNDVNSFKSLEERLTFSHPEWTQDRRHWEALSIFNTRMFPKQVESFLAEKANQLSINVDAEYSVVDGKLFNPYYSFENMIANATSPEERKSLELYQETMVKAVRGSYVIMPDLHSSHEGVHTVRYADISYKDYDGKIHLTRRVNIAQGGNDLSLTGSWVHLYSLAREGQGRQLIIDGIPKVGIVVIPPTEKIFSGQSNNHYQRLELKSTNDMILAYISHLAYEVSQNVIQDISETAKSVHMYFVSGQHGRKEQGKKVSVLPLIKDRPISVKAIEKSVRRHQKKENKRQKKLERASKTKHVMEYLSQKPRTERKGQIKKKSYEHGRRVFLKEGKRPKKEAKINKKEAKRKKIELKKALKQKFIRPESIETKSRKKRTKKETKQARKEILRTRKEKKRLRKKTKEVAVAALLPKKDSLVMKRKESHFTERRIPKREKKLWRGLKTLARKLEKSHRKEEKGANKRPVIEKNNKSQGETFVPIKKEQKKKLIRKLSFAWVLWLVTQEREAKKLPQAVNQKELKPKHDVEVLRQPYKQPPWVIFSIIWYLTAIREHGLATSNKKPNQKKLAQIVIPQALIRQQGVIFAFGS